MKRTLILFLVLTTFINCLTAQVTLQHTFTGNLSYQGQLVPKLDYYLSTDATTNQVRFYNPNFSLYKTVKYKLIKN